MEKLPFWVASAFYRRHMWYYCWSLLFHLLNSDFVSVNNSTWLRNLTFKEPVLLWNKQYMLTRVVLFNMTLKNWKVYKEMSSQTQNSGKPALSFLRSTVLMDFISYTGSTFQSCRMFQSTKSATLANCLYLSRLQSFMSKMSTWNQKINGPQLWNPQRGTPEPWTFEEICPETFNNSEISQNYLVIYGWWAWLT